MNNLITPMLFLLLIWWLLASDCYAEYFGECDCCIKRFIFYEVDDYKLCEKCYFEYEKEGQIKLHPSRVCGVWCAHSSGLDDKCPFKDVPYYIKKEP